MNQWHYHSVWMFLLLLLVPVVAYFLFRTGQFGRIRFSYTGLAEQTGRSWRVRLRPILVFCRLAALVLIIIALTRPQKGVSESRVTTRGVLLELVVDHSTSMRSPMAYRGNQEVSRLDVVKNVLGDFVQGGEGFRGRPNDLLGLIMFARYADTLCPLVHAHDALLGYLDNINYAPESEDGTSIGEGIALAAARLERAEQDIAQRNARLENGNAEDATPAPGEFHVESKAIVLLTDGQDNAPPDMYSPIEAAEFAKEAGIKIYTIGIGGNPVQRGFFAMPAPLDEPLLRHIADSTGGLYARADNPEALRTVIEAIDKLEKSEIEVVEYSRYDEKFFIFAVAGLALLLTELLLTCTIFRKVP